MEIIVQDGQTLADIAIQEFGSLEAVVQLSIDNSMSVSDIPKAGSRLRLHSRVYNKVMQDFCKVNAVAPATLRDETKKRQGVFNDAFNELFA